jgi:hypothetical protein
MNAIPALDGHGPKLDSVSRLRLLRFASIFPFFVVAAFSLAIYGYFHNSFWWAPDDGAYAHVAERLLTGEVLNKSVSDIHAGYVNFVNAFSLKLFGADLVSMRYPLVLMGVIQSLIVFFIFRDRGLVQAAIGALTVSALSTVQFLNPTAHWYCLFLFLLIVFFMSTNFEGRSYGYETLGFLLVTLVLFRQLTGVLTTIGVLTYILIKSPKESGNSEVAARILIFLMFSGLIAYLIAKTNLAGWVMFGIWPLAILLWSGFHTSAKNRFVFITLKKLALGGALGATPILVYHISNDSLGTWFNDVVLAAFHLANLEFIQQANYGVLFLLSVKQVVSFNSVAPVLNGIFWMLLLIAPVFLGASVLKKVLHSHGSFTIHPLPFLAVFYGMVSVHFQIPIYLFYSVSVSLLGLLWFSSDKSKLVRFPFFLLLVFTSLVGIYYHAGQPLSRGMVGILQGERVPLVASELAKADLYIGKEDRDLYKHLVFLINAETEAGDSIFAYPSNSELYFLGGRRNPARFFNSGIGVTNEIELQRLLATLSSSPPKLVFYQSRDKYNTAASRKIMDYVSKNYVLLETHRGFEIYKYSGDQLK